MRSNKVGEHLRMNKNKWIVVFLIFSIVTSACRFLQFNNLKEQDIVGVWKQDNKECKDSLPRSMTIVPSLNLQ